MLKKKEPFGVLFLSKNPSLRYSLYDNRTKHVSYRTKCVDKNRPTALIYKGVERFNLF